MKWKIDMSSWSAPSWVLREILILLLHLLQGVWHILHPTVVVLQGFLANPRTTSACWLAAKSLWDFLDWWKADITTIPTSPKLVSGVEELWRSQDSQQKHFHVLWSTTAISILLRSKTQKQRTLSCKNYGALNLRILAYCVLADLRRIAKVLQRLPHLGKEKCTWKALLAKERLYPKPLQKQSTLPLRPAAVESLHLSTIFDQQKPNSTPSPLWKSFLASICFRQVNAIQQQAKLKIA